MGMVIPNIGKKLISRFASNTIVFNRRAETSAISITFDDGPHPQYSPMLLDILDQRGIKASFFIIGAEAEKYPNIVQDMHRRGHLVCNHGYEHLDASKAAIARYIEDIENCQNLLETLCAASLPKLFRPPFGIVTPASLLATRRMGFKTVIWDRDSRDSHAYSAQEVTAEVIGAPIAPGCILLFHDDYEVTTQVLPTILDSLIEKKHQFTRLDQRGN